MGSSFGPALEQNHIYLYKAYLKKIQNCFYRYVYCRVCKIKYYVCCIYIYIDRL